MAMRKDVDPNTLIYIYALIDPRDKSVRYIGWTQNISRRLTTHIWEANHNFKNHKSNWIRTLISENLKPIIQTVEKTIYSKKDDREQYWIKHYGRENLTNGTNGGEGALGLIVSEESRKLQSERQKSDPKWGKWALGKKITNPETLKKLSDSHMGQQAWNKGKLTPYVLEYLTPFKKGNVPYNKGIPRDEETKDKISKAKSGVRIGKKKKNTASQYVGVVLEKKTEVWVSQIRYDKTNHFVGRFKQEDAAGMAYDIYSLYIVSPDCNLNFPELREKYISYLNQYEISSIKELRQIIKDYISQGGLN